MNTKYIEKETNINIHNDILKIHTQENKNMGWGIIDNIDMIFPNFITKKLISDNIKICSKIMHYSINKLYNRIFTEGDKVLEDIKNMGFDIYDKDFIKVKYDNDKKTAIIRTFIYNKNTLKFDIDPYFSIEGDAYGLTITPGNMSDFIITSNGDYLFAYSKDIYRKQFGIISVLIRDYCNNIKEILIDNKIPEDFEQYSSNNNFHLLLSEQMVNNKKKIQEHILKLITRNQKCRIDKVNNFKGEGIYELIKKYDIKYITFFSNTHLMKVCLELGKTPKQVYNFIDKFLKKEKI